MSISPLTFENADSVLDRFNRFNDGIIRSIELTFKTNRDNSEAVVTVSTRDTSADGDWVNVIFRIHGLCEVTFVEGRTSFIVLSDGLHVSSYGGLVFLDFGAYSTSPRGIEDLRKSGCYLGGQSATWEVIQYSE
jgi:hypothetical protein